DQAKGNIALPGRGLAAALAGKFDLGTGPGPAENVGIHQRIVNDRVAILQRMIGEQRHEPWRTRSCAHEPNAPVREWGKRLMVKKGKSRHPPDSAAKPFGGGLF